jgi:hypothetical protein
MKQIEILAKSIEVPKKCNIAANTSNSIRWCCLTAEELQKYQIQPKLVKRTKRSMKRLWTNIRSEVTGSNDPIEEGMNEKPPRLTEEGKRDILERHEKRSQTMIATNAPKRDTKEHEKLMSRLRRAASTNESSDNRDERAAVLKKNISLEL